MFLKRSFSLLVVVALFQSASAQNCESSYYAKTGARFETTDYDPKGVVKSVTTNTVTDVQNSSGLNASVKSVKIDATNKTTEEKTLHYTCDEKGVKWGMGADDTKTKKEAILDYPATMAAGMVMKNDVTFEYSKKEKGQNFKYSQKITDRKVTGKEQVSVKAGSWECTKLAYKTRIKFGVGMFMVPVDLDVTEWFNPSVGVVKTEFSIKGTKAGHSELTAVSN